jgi:hypothetical protein
MSFHRKQDGERGIEFHLNLRRIQDFACGAGKSNPST